MYSGLLIKRPSEFVRTRLGKLGKGVLVLHDYAPAHKAHQAVQLAEHCGFEILPHPAYSPDLVPSDFFLFSNLKNHSNSVKVKGRHLSDKEEAIEVFEDWIGAQT